MSLIDEVRGLAIISMVAYHFVYDMVMIFRRDWPWFFEKNTAIWQAATAITFIAIAGVCTQYSGRPFLRALKICGCALLITAATYFVYPDQLIMFGILHFLGVSMLIYAVFRRLLVKVNPWPGFIVSIILMAVTWNISKGIIGIGAMTVNIPDSVFNNYWLFPLVYIPSFISADYFPLFPYFFIFMAGSYLGYGFKRLTEIFSKEHIKPLCLIGRHSLIIYMTHQLIIFGALTLVFRFLDMFFA